MLSTAAWLDFKQHIILVQARLWQSVGMVLHLPPGDGASALGCPPFCCCLALRNSVKGAGTVLGVSDFRGSAPGRGGMSWLKLVRALHPFGPDTLNIMMPSSFWASRWRAAIGCSGTRPRPRYGLWPAWLKVRCGPRGLPGGVEALAVGVWVWLDPVNALDLPWCRRPGIGPLVGEASTWGYSPGHALPPMWGPHGIGGAQLAGFFPCLALCLAMAMQPQGIYARQVLAMGSELTEPGASSSSVVAADHVRAWRSARGLPVPVRVCRGELRWPQPGWRWLALARRTSA